jgi:hypothetical protein
VFLSDRNYLDGAGICGFFSALTLVFYYFSVSRVSLTVFFYNGGFFTFFQYKYIRTRRRAHAAFNTTFPVDRNLHPSPPQAYFKLYQFKAAT